MTEPNNQHCFIDSNIWLYAFSTDQKDNNKRKIAKNLIQKTSFISISTQVINEVSCNLLKNHKLDEASLLKLIISFYGKYNVVSFNLEILQSSSSLRNQYHLSFWDSLIVACALDSESNILYSEDMQNALIINQKMTIINPFEMS